MLFSSFYPIRSYGTSNVMKARINKAQGKYANINTGRTANTDKNTVTITKSKPKIILDDNQQTNTFKKIGIAIGAIAVGYCAKNIIGAVVYGLKSGGTAFKEFLSRHTKGSIHEALGGIYHTVAGTGKIITSPLRGLGKLARRATKG